MPFPMPAHPPRSVPHIRHSASLSESREENMQRLLQGIDYTYRSIDSSFSLSVIEGWVIINSEFIRKHYPSSVWPSWVINPEMTCDDGLAEATKKIGEEIGVLNPCVEQAAGFARHYYERQQQALKELAELPKRRAGSLGPLSAEPWPLYYKGVDYTVDKNGEVRFNPTVPHGEREAIRIKEMNRFIMPIPLSKPSLKERFLKWLDGK